MKEPNQWLCNVCNKETLFLMKRNSKSVNNREEFGGYCAHKHEWLLQNIKAAKLENKKKES